MSRKERAQAFFARYLPAPILAVADLSQLVLVESKHISDAGISLYNDILYRCPLGPKQIGYFFAMSEHQSQPYAKMPLRFLHYDTATMMDHDKQGYDKLPIVINIVVYHGAKPWNYSTALADYYADPQLGSQYLYLAPYILVNLPAQPIQKIYADKDLGYCFAAFRCTSSPDPYQAFARSLQSPIFQEHFERLPAEEKYLVLKYLGHCIDQERHSLEKLVNLAVNNKKEKEEAMVTIAQAYQQAALQQGIQKGMQQGIETRNLEIAKSMLFDLKLDIDMIQKATKLDRREIEKILKEG